MFRIIVFLFCLFIFNSCEEATNPNQSRMSYLDTPVPVEIQKYFKRPIKWDKWRQEAWLRGDIEIDSNQLGHKFLVISHHRSNSIIPPGAVEIGKVK